MKHLNFLLASAIILLSFVGSFVSAQTLEAIDSLPKTFNYQSDTLHYRVTGSANVNMVFNNRYPFRFGFKKKSYLDTAFEAELVIGQFDFKGEPSAIRFSNGSLKNISLHESADGITYTDIPVGKSYIYREFYDGIPLKPTTKYVKIKIIRQMNEGSLGEISVGLTTSKRVSAYFGVGGRASKNYIVQNGINDSLLRDEGSFIPIKGQSTFSNEILFGRFDLSGELDPFVQIDTGFFKVHTMTLYESPNGIDFTPATIIRPQHPKYSDICFQLLSTTKFLKVKNTDSKLFGSSGYISTQNPVTKRPENDFLAFYNLVREGFPLATPDHYVTVETDSGSFESYIYLYNADFRTADNPYLVISPKGINNDNNSELELLEVASATENGLFQTIEKTNTWGWYALDKTSRHIRIKYKLKILASSPDKRYTIFDEIRVIDFASTTDFSQYPIALTQNYFLDSANITILKGDGYARLSYDIGKIRFGLSRYNNDDTLAFRIDLSMPTLPTPKDIGGGVGVVLSIQNHGVTVDIEYSYDGKKYYKASRRLLDDVKTIIVPTTAQKLRLNIESTTSGDLTVVFNEFSTVDLPSKDLFYDFDEKDEFGYLTRDVLEDGHIRLYQTDGLSQNFGWKEIAVFEEVEDETPSRFDIDGYERMYADKEGFSVQMSWHWGGTSYSKSFLYQRDGSYKITQSSGIIPFLDLNNDGRLDYLYHDGLYHHRPSSVPPDLSNAYIAYQQPNGSFSDAHIKTMTFAEYDPNQSFDEDEWVTAATRHGLGKATPPTIPIPPSGSCLAKSPPRKNLSAGSKAMTKAQLPTAFADLNKDGIPDMLSPKVGTLFYGGGEHTYFTTSLDGNVLTKDFNNDGISDYIVYGGESKKITAYIYQGEGLFTEQLLYQNLTVDNTIHCYDFDKDGDVDVLITFSTYKNATKANYTLLCKNDGTGKFSLIAKTTNDNWKFLTCADIDNDGLMELFHVRFKDTATTAPDHYNRHGIAEIQYRKINANFTFGDTITLFRKGFHGANLNPEEWNLHVADIDRDGNYEIWLQKGFRESYVYTLSDGASRVESRISGGHLHHFTNTNSNTRPEKPAKPQLTYNAGIGRLDIRWELGRDAENSAMDLTYALRVGTAPGKGDIFAAHAFDDGTRRNFKNGNMGYELSHWFDCKSWKPGTYYVSIQSIDAMYSGSEFSEDATFEHSYLPSTFSLSKLNQGTITSFDTVELFYNQYPNLKYEWELSGATKIDSAMGYFQLQWPKSGEKTLWVSVSQGDSVFSDKYETKIFVLPNKIVAYDSIGTKILSGSSERPYRTVMDDVLVDYNFDGALDAVREGLSGTTNGLYVNNGKGLHTQDQELYNTALNPSNVQWLDLTNNGRLDMFFTSDNEYKYLKHSDDQKGYFGLFAESLSHCEFWNGTEKETWESVTWGNNFFLKDMNNDGLWDVVSTYSDEGFIFIYFNEGYNNEVLTFKRAPSIIPYSSGLSSGVWMDFNRDGFLDYADITYSDVASDGRGFYILYFYENTGQKTEPFKVSKLKRTHFSRDGRWFLKDMNADGFLDIVRHSGRNVVIEWNQNNEKFADSLVLSANNNFGTIDNLGFGFSCFDFDNNGYLDIGINVIDQRDHNVKSYVFYFDAQGLMAQGFLSDVPFMSLTNFADIDNDNIPDYLLGALQYDSRSYFQKMRAANSNTQPHVPSNIVAQQTKQGLLIEWEPSFDAETPFAHMRYNLSVKKKGETGANSYVYSPLNDGDTAMAVMPRLNGYLNYGEEQERRRNIYLQSTKILIPSFGLSGELEISLQAIDQWDAQSAFSEPIVLKMKDVVELTMPSQACHNEAIEINFLGTQTGTPVWDFDGGEVHSGSAWGPYFVKWDSPGIKVVKVSNGGDTAEAQTLVHNPLTGFNMPFTDVYTSRMRPGRTSDRKAIFDTSFYEFTVPYVLPRENFFSWDLMVKASQYYQYAQENVHIISSPGQKDASVWFEDRQFYDNIKLVFNVHLNNNACKTSYEKELKLMPPLQAPQISYLSQNNGKLLVNWDTNYVDKHIDEIIIYKEGTTFNQFIEIGRVPRKNASFIDELSNINVRSEAYRIEGVVHSPHFVSDPSALHQSIRLNITKGNDGKLTLIWSPYIGCKINQFRVLRGASPTAMKVVATLDGDRVFYLDANPNSEELYYSLEYDPIPNEQYASRAKKSQKNTAVVKTNTVFAGDASQVVNINKMNILAIQKTVEINDSQPSLYLFAEIFPSNATYQNVTWSIVSGSDKATINSAGVLAGKPNQTGKIKVRVSSTDGSGVYGERSIDIKAFALFCNEPYNLNVIQPNDSSASFTWDGNHNEYVVSYFDTLNPTAVYRKTVATNYLNLTSFDFPQKGVYRWTVQGKCGDNNYSNIITGKIFTIVKIATTPAFYSLSISKQGEGSVSPDIGEYYFEEGTQVSLQATPNAGWVFYTWVINGENIYTNPFTFTMQESKSAMAVFEFKIETSPVKSEEAWRIYPNPVSEKLVVNDCKGILKIMSPLGVLIKTIYNPGVVEIDVQDLKDGSYLLQSPCGTIRFIKQ